MRTGISNSTRSAFRPPRVWVLCGALHQGEIDASLAVLKGAARPVLGFTKTKSLTAASDRSLLETRWKMRQTPPADRMKYDG